LYRCSPSRPVSSSYCRTPDFGTAVVIDKAERQPTGFLIPRPRSIRGNRTPSTTKSFASSSRVIGRVPSRVLRRIQSSAAGRTASSLTAPTTRLFWRSGLGSSDESR
jgi:hypothetical protein